MLRAIGRVLHWIWSGLDGLRKVLTLVFLLTTLGLGLFVSTVSQNQQQAMMTAVFFFVVPMMYRSGFVFPSSRCPAGSSGSPT